ncbi:MAG: hypothetical protein H5T63_05530, partial [Chloroflexi bacterium]|nr:hypothetical protein [Chloroflexota bacterium]
MRQRRKITNLALAFIAVLIGIYAQNRIRRPELLYQSLALYILAAAIFVIALRRDVQQAGQATYSQPTRVLSLARRRAVIALAAVSLLCCLVGLGLFYQDRPLGIAWFFYLSSVAGSLITAWAAEAEVRLPTPQEVLSRLLHPTREHILVALLVLAAFTLRFYRIEQQPLGLWYDEAD